MNLPRPLSLLRFLALLCLGVSISAQQVKAESDVPADSRPVEDGWMLERDEQTGIQIRTKELTLHPQGEPQPALKHQFIPDEFQVLPGNAAVYYLKALGFLEQDPARERVLQFQKDAVAQSREEGKDINQLAPYAWLSTAPDELPLEEVKSYLRPTSFQPPMIREGARRKRFDMDRNIREVDDPIALLLPEIQGMRELARTQSIRCRVAIAEDRIDDAMAIIGQQLAMARHLGQDDFLISNLVGIAISSIAWNDALYLVQHAEAPNLYWALATMPSPLVDIRASMATERQILYQQVKILREVDETPRPAGYWQDFIDRLLPQMGYLASELHLSVEDDAEMARAAVVGFVAAAYPGAKEYLIHQRNLPQEQVEDYPTAQVVFLAMVWFYDDWRDEVFKWAHLPLWQVRTKTPREEVESELQRESEQYGWCTMPTQLLLPAVLAARTAEARCDQNIALLQTVEAIRMYAAAHDNQLPPSLDALPVPAPIDPFSGKPIDYELFGARAMLNGHNLPGMRHRLILRIAE